MTAAIDPLLQPAIEAVSRPGIFVGHRLISRGDEFALRDEESRAMPAGPVQARRASGAARIVARQLLARHGFADCPVLREPSGAPIWPVGVTGSLAHDSRIAVAAVGMSRHVGALGIDVEPAEDLPSDLLELIATSWERSRLADDPYRGRLLFAAKEAAYKAVYPLDHMVLDHHDIEVDLARSSAVTRNGRVLELRLGLSAHLVVLAVLAKAMAGAGPRPDTGLALGACGRS
jgi:4'-phosphopantetheinyl transferase EntD